MLSACSSSPPCSRYTTRSTLSSHISARKHTIARFYSHSSLTRSRISDDGVKCKHGPSECLGNIIELCARELYPDPKISLGFVMCLTRDYKNIPERTLVEDCALEHAMDIRKLNECATRDDGAHGLELLRNSAQHSADVCTILYQKANPFYAGYLTHLLRSTPPLAAPFASTKKSTASATTANGRTAPTAPRLTTLSCR